VFVAIGLLLGLALEEKAAGGAIGIVGTVLAVLGGLWVPAELFPAGLQVVAHALPSYWYAELGRDVAAGETPAPAGVAVLVGAAAAAGALAAAVARRRPLYAVGG
jgi:ABC-2 type transport system permease protein